MALLQIAEPGRAAAPHQHRLAVGIDLGTTNSLVASVRSGVTEVLCDEQGRALVPSVVHFAADGSTVVGHDAAVLQATDPLNTIASAKRLIGRRLADIPPGSMPLRLEDMPGMVGVRTQAGLKSPIDVGAEVLRTLRLRAEAALGGTLVGAVITVPAYFDDAQRQATKEAAQQAGLPVLRLLNEPTAAAVAYGLDTANEGVYVVYDLGGGTFDVSILRLSRGIFEVLATNGDPMLGGDDFDRCIVQWFLQRTGLERYSGADLSGLLRAARRAKEALTDAVSVEMAWAAREAEAPVVATLTRPEFEAMSADLVARTMAPVRKALRDAGFKPDEVDGIVLVGGATRMPQVRAAVEKHFGKPPYTGVDPDQAVALGAALQADQLAGNRGGDGMLLLDVCPLSLGLETMGGLVEKIIPRNATLPTARAQDFTTFKDGQTAMALHVVQGERELVSECRSLARFTLRGIPPLAAGAARIRVTFQVDADGLLSVTAMEQSTGVQAHVEVKPSYGLSNEHVVDMLKDAISSAEYDAKSRMAREAQVDARRLLDATEAALHQDGEALLSPAERQEVLTAMQGVVDLLEAAAQGGPDVLITQRDALRQATEHLNQATSTFAMRRMDASIKAALSGRKLEQVA